MVVRPLNIRQRFIGRSSKYKILYQKEKKIKYKYDKCENVKYNQIMCTDSINRDDVGISGSAT